MNRYEGKRVRVRVCRVCDATGFVDPNESTGFAPYIYNYKVPCPECKGTAWIVKDDTIREASNER